MTLRCGSQNEVGTLRSVLVKRPDAEFGAADPATWHYDGRPDLKIAQVEHDDLVAKMRQAGVEVFYHDERQPGRADAVYVRDPALIVEPGAVILRMGKLLRRGEEESMARRLEELGVPVYYTLHGDALAEGGDLLWVDRQTLAVGVGFRTNTEGVRQLEEALRPLGVDVFPFHLPYHGGPDACLHLTSFISLVDHHRAAVYPPLMPVLLWQFLEVRGFEFIEVPKEDLDTMGPNVLALGPGKCLMLEGNSGTKRRLEAAGCDVLTYTGQEISLKAEGGPTCLTRPILRED